MERAWERQQEDTEKEMKRRLGGKKQTSSFLPQNPWDSMNLNNQVSSKNNLSAANASGSSNERLLEAKKAALSDCGDETRPRLAVPRARFVWDTSILIRQGCVLTQWIIGANDQFLSSK